LAFNIAKIPELARSLGKASSEYKKTKVMAADIKYRIVTVESHSESMCTHNIEVLSQTFCHRLVFPYSWMSCRFDSARLRTNSLSRLEDNDLLQIDATVIAGVLKSSVISNVVIPSSKSFVKIF
jgi:hypothetical protein